MNNEACAKSHKTGKLKSYTKCKRMVKEVQFDLFYQLIGVISVKLSFFLTPSLIIDILINVLDVSFCCVLVSLLHIHWIIILQSRPIEHLRYVVLLSIFNVFLACYCSQSDLYYIYCALYTVMNRQGVCFLWLLTSDVWY